MDAVADGVRGELFHLHARIVLPCIIASANRVLVSSTDYASHSALAGIGNVLSRVEVHPFGVDTERFHPGHEPALRERLGIALDETMVIFVSRLDPAHHFKGLPILLDAWTRLRRHGWRLVVVGEGSQRHGFEQLAASLRIADRVSFAGDVSDADLPAYYRAADVHVCPSTAAAEAFSLVTLEAAASGIPTVASSLPGVRTVVVHGETGVHVAPSDPVSLGLVLESLVNGPARTAPVTASKNCGVAPSAVTKTVLPSGENPKSASSVLLLNRRPTGMPGRLASAGAIMVCPNTVSPREKRTWEPSGECTRPPSAYAEGSNLNTRSSLVPMSN
jgi:glycosyltransferase involved in cell wall biosynthesis